MKVVLKFTRRHQMYNAGEIAGFKPDYARRLVSAGVARYHTPELPPVQNPDAQDTSPHQQEETGEERASDARGALAAAIADEDTVLVRSILKDMGEKTPRSNDDLLAHARAVIEG